MVLRGRTRRRARVGKGNFNRIFGRHALHHEFGGGLRLRGEDETTNTFILPIVAMDTSLSAPDSVYVNPRNSSKTNLNDHLTRGSSIVKKFHYNFKMWPLPQMYADGLRKLRVQVMPLCVRYADLDKEAIGETIGTYIPLVEHSGDTKIRPNWSGSDMIAQHGDFYDGDGLTTDNKHESVAFDAEAFETALAEKPISPLLRKVTNGGLRGFDCLVEHPMTWQGTQYLPKKAQLQTEHTFYGLLIHLPQLDSEEQYYDAADTTAAQLWFHYDISFYEWNKEFNQNVA